MFLSLRDSSATVFASYATFRVFMSSLPLTVSSSLRTVYPYDFDSLDLPPERERERRGREAQRLEMEKKRKKETAKKCTRRKRKVQTPRFVLYQLFFLLSLPVRFLKGWAEFVSCCGVHSTYQLSLLASRCITGLGRHGRLFTSCAKPSGNFLEQNYP